MNRKAVLLFSGGLDSSLAFKILEEDAEIYGVVFSTPFVDISENVFNLAASIGLPLLAKKIGGEYYDILLHPKHGYGKGVNPCLDCKILMLKKAKEYMREIGAGFVITGEVLGQRPMSQKKRDFIIAEKETGLEGLIVRPLSGKILPPTVPEKEGAIKREKLLALSGRSRKVQMDLARRFNIYGYSTPAGGCILADLAFTRRVKDAIAYGEITDEKVEFLKAGRHFRLKNGSKLIIARNEKESAGLKKVSKNFILMETAERTGPAAVLTDEKDILQALSFLARYNKKAGKFSIVKNGGKTEMTADPAAEEEIKKHLI
ncbi:MAG: tRNA 4-thiouridine(8) synthase ThiI [bacterium]